MTGLAEHTESIGPIVFEMPGLRPRPLVTFFKVSPLIALAVGFTTLAVAWRGHGAATFWVLCGLAVAGNLIIGPFVVLLLGVEVISCLQCLRARRLLKRSIGSLDFSGLATQIMLATGSSFGHVRPVAMRMLAAEVRRRAVLGRVIFVDKDVLRSHPDALPMLPPGPYRAYHNRAGLRVVAGAIIFVGLIGAAILAFNSFAPISQLGAGTHLRLSLVGTLIAVATVVVASRAPMFSIRIAEDIPGGLGFVNSRRFRPSIPADAMVAVVTRPSDSESATRRTSIICAITSGTSTCLLEGVPRCVEEGIWPIWGRLVATGGEQFPLNDLEQAR